METEVYEPPMLIEIGTATELVKGELVPYCGDAGCNWWC